MRSRRERLPQVESKLPRTKYFFTSKIPPQQFGSKEYVCKGSCYCDSERRYLATGRTLAKGFQLIVFAMTSFVAVQSAQKILKDECVKQFSFKKKDGNDMCRKRDIKANVDECFDNLSLTEKEKTCPICGKPNHCMHGMKGTKCWCVGFKFPVNYHLMVPEESRDKECICQECVEKLLKERDCKCEKGSTFSESK